MYGMRTYLDALIVKGETSPDAVVESLTRLPRGIDVANLLALHVAPLPVQGCLDYSVTDCLGHYILGALLRAQMQANANVTKRNAAVTEAHHTNACLDHVLSQAKDQGIGTVAPERVRVVRDGRLKILKVTNTDGLDQKEVRMQSRLHCLLTECSSVGNVTHQQLNNEQQLGGSLAESQRAVAGRSLASCRCQMLVGLCVRELDGTNAAKIVQEARDLVVGSIFGKLCVGDQKIGLGDVGCEQVVSKQEDDDRSLSVDILAKDGGSKRGKEDRADGDDGRLGGWREWSNVFAEERVVKVHLRRERVKRPAVQRLDALGQLLGEIRAALELLRVVEIDLDEDGQEGVDLRNDILAILLGAVLRDRLGLAIYLHFRAVRPSQGDVFPIDGGEQLPGDGRARGSRYECLRDNLGEDVRRQALANGRNGSESTQGESGIKLADCSLQEGEIALDICTESTRLERGNANSRGLMG